jgi:excisionase family DNA binding protein
LVISATAHKVREGDGLMPTTAQRPTTSQLLTVSQVAELLNVSIRLVWLLAQEGNLRPVRIRTCTRWRRADVVRYINTLTAPQISVAAEPERTVASARR